MTKPVPTRRRWWPVVTVVALTALGVAGCQQEQPGTDDSPSTSSAINDQDIRAEVEHELDDHPAVQGQTISVDVAEGIVTLRGTVDNLRARRVATRLAEAIRGVRAVVNVTGVQPVRRSDAAIRRDVLDALALNAATSAYPVSVRVTGGAATLTGRLQSWVEKHLAGEVASGVRGVAVLNNEITVTYPRQRSDEAIERDVRAALKSDIRINPGAESIDVDVVNGRVWLRGSVGSAAEKSQAAYDAWVYGTRSVDDSELQVEYWLPDSMRSMQVSTPDDWDIRQAVRRAITLDPRVSVQGLRVQVEGGVVTLDGVVGSLQGKRAAEQTARDTVGVYRVVDFLEVRVQPTMDDARLAQRVRQVLTWDPALTRYHLRSGVRQHTAWVEGQVPSAYDRQLAEQVVAQIPGITAIANRIAIVPPGKAPGDRALANAVRQRLRWTPGLPANDIKFHVEDQVVTLFGEVHSAHARRLAEQRAWSAGAWRVVNKIDVKR